MKTLLILTMPIMIVATFMTSNYFFNAADYYTSAVFTIAWLCSMTLFITALSTKRTVAHS